MPTIRTQRGQATIEYTMLASLLAIVAIVGVKLCSVETRRYYCVASLMLRYSASTNIDPIVRTDRALPSMFALYDYNTGQCYSISTVMPALRGIPM